MAGPPPLWTRARPHSCRDLGTAGSPRDAGLWDGGTSSISSLSPSRAPGASGSLPQRKIFTSFPEPPRVDEVSAAEVCLENTRSTSPGPLKDTVFALTVFLVMRVGKQHEGRVQKCTSLLPHVVIHILGGGVLGLERIFWNVPSCSGPCSSLLASFPAPCDDSRFPGLWKSPVGSGMFQSCDVGVIFAVSPRRPRVAQFLHFLTLYWIGTEVSVLLARRGESKSSASPLF